MSNILEINGVCKDFSRFSLRDISFTLQEGFIMGLIGPNGAGKTTTIKLILNMLSRSAGNIEVFGLDNIKNEQSIKERIGIVMDNSFYAEEWRVADIGNILAPFYKRWDRKMFDSMLCEFGLDVKKKIKELSRGMKMKLMIAAALSHDAELLILDEPTSGLDAVARNELLEILSDFIANERKAVLFSTHITADLEKTADFITFINDGKLMYTGTKDELLEHYRIVKGGSELNSKAREFVLGYRGHGVGFDGLIKAADLKYLPASIHSEPASLDDIMLRFNIGGGEHE